MYSHTRAFETPFVAKDQRAAGGVLGGQVAQRDPAVVAGAAAGRAARGAEQHTHAARHVHAGRARGRWQLLLKHL